MLIPNSVNQNTLKEIYLQGDFIDSMVQCSATCVLEAISLFQLAEIHVEALIPVPNKQGFKFSDWRYVKTDPAPLSFHCQEGYMQPV